MNLTALMLGENTPTHPPTYLPLQEKKKPLPSPPPSILLLCP